MTIVRTDSEYQRGFFAGCYVCDCQITRDEAVAFARDLKCEAFKRGFGDGYRHMGSCNGEVIPGEYPECDDAAAITIRSLQKLAEHSERG